MSNDKNSTKSLTKVEAIKTASNYLRGTIEEGLLDTSTGALGNDDIQLTKFHGFYQQDDRDLRRERRRMKLEKAFSFMIRIRVPGGICSAGQYVQLDDLSNSYANGTIKLTTRQAFQFHGVLKGDLKPIMKGINDSLLDTLAACGDVNRNVMCSANPFESSVHQEVYEFAGKLSDHLSPKTRAYYEMWVDDEKVVSTVEDHEPIYGKTYLPRKFKIGIAIPPDNDVDVLTQDVGLIAIVDAGKLIGFNVTVGGGMGMSHGKEETFPRLGDTLGFISPDSVIPVAEAIVTTQRDFGDRTNRRHARLKYTIEDRGIEWFRQEVESRSGITFQTARSFTFSGMSDRYGWVEGINGKWHYTLFIMSGRIKDSGELKLKTGLREIAKVHKGDLRLTGNQNLIISNVSASDKGQIEALLERYGLVNPGNLSGLRRNALSCVALPTCGLALAESERELPQLVAKIETILEEAGLRDDEITLRITGCPNGCARPYNAEIGLVGRAPGKYNLYLGAAFDGSRLNKLYKNALREEEILAELDTLIRAYAKERGTGERFGDFLVRIGVVEATACGREFHS